MTLELHLELKSDTTFGRGDGIAGLVDAEVEHDAATGLPYLRGRTLKGLLVEECASVLFALSKHNASVCTRFERAAQFLFGQGGSSLSDDAIMHVGAAMLPADLRYAVEADITHNNLTPTEVLESLTAIRRQTAIDEVTGAPDEGSLRSMRVVLRNTSFIAQLDFEQEPNSDALALLAACVMSLRRAGTGRNRGRGRLTARLYDQQGQDVTGQYFTSFKRAVKGDAP
jgi:CRISPR/Cas system CSM-associated protein Csm3 (group 7 of RAMP superfamily)